jgi:hypothetical protein
MNVPGRARCSRWDWSHVQPQDLTESILCDLALITSRISFRPPDGVRAGRTDAGLFS